MADVDKDVNDDLMLNSEPVLSLDDSVAGESLNDLQTPGHSQDGGNPWRSYPCTNCDNVVFTSQSLLQYHRVQMHRPHKCQKCGVVLIGRQNFSKHVHKEHPGLPLSKVFVHILWCY